MVQKKRGNVVHFLEMRMTDALEWTRKITNYTEDEHDLLERCIRDHRKPTDTKIYKKMYLGRREIAAYRENKASM